MPEPVTQILNKVLQEASAASVSALLFDLRDSAQSVQRRVARLFRRHASGHVFLDLLLKMLAQLLFHFFIHLIGMEKSAHTQSQGVEPLFEIHVQASLSFTMPEIAAETRFQLAVSFSSCFRPSRVSE